MSLENYHIDDSWTLFLDRDGVINHRLIDGYIKTPDEFRFTHMMPDSFKILNKIFGRVIVITNQQGIGKGLMTSQDLEIVHQFMIDEIEKQGGQIDQVYFCPELAETNHINRKPRIGMALEAKKDFSNIDFSKSVMVGDSLSDMEFGKNAGMITIFIAPEQTKYNQSLVDYHCGSLGEFAKIIEKIY